MAVVESSTARTLRHGLLAATTLLVALVALVAVPEAKARCASRYVTVWPEGGSVPTNSMFLIEAFGLDQEWLAKLEPCELRLVASDDAVCLKVVDSYRGEANIRQVLLKPKRYLQPGLTYRLEFSGSWDESKLTHSVPPMEKRTWTVTSTADYLAPQWRQAPVVKKAERAIFGCGPAHRAWVQVSAIEEHPTLAKVSLREQGESEVRQYLLPVDGPIQVGHGMCSGAFALKPKGRYSIQIELMDVAGNPGESPSERLLFEIPEAPQY